MCTFAKVKRRGSLRGAMIWPKKVTWKFRGHVWLRWLCLWEVICVVSDFAICCFTCFLVFVLCFLFPLSSEDFRSCTLPTYRKKNACMNRLSLSQVVKIKVLDILGLRFDFSSFYCIIISSWLIWTVQKKNVNACMRNGNTKDQEWDPLNLFGQFCYIWRV